jgi:hypothetical protein
MSYCCDLLLAILLAVGAAHGSAMSDSEFLSAIKAAYSNTQGDDGGVVVSASPSGVEPDLSASIMRADLPQALWNPGNGAPSIHDSSGVMYSPGQALEYQCTYPMDAGTSSRTPDRCGTNPKYPEGALCDFPDLRYGEQFLFNPTEGDVWPIQKASCHFKSAQEAMVAQVSLWTRAFNEASEADWNKYTSGVRSGPYAYNEMVLKSSPPAFGGLFWAHSGPFRAATSSDRQACCLHQNACTGDLSSFPIIEIANQELENDPLTFEQLQEYGNQYKEGGFLADDIFQLYNRTALCALDCQISQSCARNTDGIILP